jgi:hypothetical protein
MPIDWNIHGDHFGGSCKVEFWEMPMGWAGQDMT